MLIGVSCMFYVGVPWVCLIICVVNFIIVETHSVRKNVSMIAFDFSKPQHTTRTNRPNIFMIYSSTTPNVWEDPKDTEDLTLL